MRSNDPVLLSYVVSLLRDAEVNFVVLDENMSLLEGSIGILQRRVMVTHADAAHARDVLIEADLAMWIRDDDQA